jgi:AcrR family transcriptional regulator
MGRKPRAKSGGKSGGNTHRRAAEILEAAAQVFARLGYHGASTQDIADVLGVKQASLYYYFPSKEAALENVCTRGVEDFYKAAQAIASGPGTAAEKLAGLVRSHIAPILDRGDFVKVFLTQRQFLPNESRRHIGQWSRQIETTFETVIKAGIKNGEFRDDIDPRLMTLAILGMANSVPTWYGKEQASIERIGNQLVPLILHGLMTPPAANRRSR